MVGVKIQKQRRLFWQFLSHFAKNGAFRFLKIFNFNLDVLSLSCMTSLDAVGEYVLRVLLMPLLMLVALLVHVGPKKIHAKRVVHSWGVPKK